MMATLLVAAAVAFFLTMPSAGKKSCTEHFWQLCRRGKKVATNCAGIEKKNGKMSMLVSIGSMSIHTNQRVVLQFDCDDCKGSFAETLYIGRYAFEHNCPEDWKIACIPSKPTPPKI